MIKLGEVFRSLLVDPPPRSEADRMGFADYLREHQTPPERMMARVLFHLGVQAEPQVSLSGFVVDFCDEQNRVVIEVDGPDHVAGHSKDVSRDAAIERLGYRVIRVWNDQVPMLLQDIALARHAG